jgi:membrane protein
MKNGAGAIITALNIVNEVEETRSFIRRAVVTVGVATSVVGTFVLATVAILAFTLLQGVFPGSGSFADIGFQIGVWLATGFAVRIAMSLIYRFAPNRPRGPATRSKKGSAFATLGWMAATAGFAVYARELGGYNAIYSILGSIVMFLTWLYASAYIILLGAELNRILEPSPA